MVMGVSGYEVTAEVPRDHMRASLQLDGPAFARAVENAYHERRHAWGAARSTRNSSDSQRQIPGTKLALKFSVSSSGAFRDTMRILTKPGAA